MEVSFEFFALLANTVINSFSGENTSGSFFQEADFSAFDFSTSSFVFSNSSLVPHNFLNHKWLSYQALGQGLYFIKLLAYKVQFFSTIYVTAANISYSSAYLFNKIFFLISSVATQESIIFHISTFSFINSQVSFSALDFNCVLIESGKILQNFSANLDALNLFQRSKCSFIASTIIVQP